jgi:carboxyl-terminal processing protease
MSKVRQRSAFFALALYTYILPCYGEREFFAPKKSGQNQGKKAPLAVAKPFVASGKKMDEIAAGATFLNVLRLLLDEYVDHIGPKEMQKILEGAIQGALSSLDPHSGIVQQTLLTEMAGEFGGLGVQLLPVTIPGSDRSELTVMSVLESTPKTPAQIAGLKPNDVIVSVDNVFYERHDHAIKQLRGAPGSKVSLNIRRKVDGEDKFFQVVLTRAIIKVDSVKFHLEPNTNIGYLRISIFDAKTSKLVANALREMYRLNPKIGCIIVDLRNNYGGYLEQAIKVANFFIPSGVIVKIKDRKGTISHKAVPRNVIVGKNGLYDTALLVLVNGHSASASEILASALKDHQRAIIAGQITFGKGSVQEIHSIDPELSFKFTTSRFYSPHGSPIQGAGVVPDVILKPNPLAHLPQRIELKESNLSGSLEQKRLPETQQNVMGSKGLKGKEESTLNPLIDRKKVPHLACAFSQNTIPEEKGTAPDTKKEVDYELLQAMDLAKALAAQFNQLYEPQKRADKK